MFFILCSMAFIGVVLFRFLCVIHYFWRWLAGGERASFAASQHRRASHGEELALSTVYKLWYPLIIIFLVASILGLLLEQVWVLLTQGILQNRPGLIWGPFSPLYGAGAVLLSIMSIVLKRVRAKDWQVFLAGSVVGGVLEQLTGWIMQTLFNAVSWTYESYPDAITQWVAWRFLFMWGALGFIWCKFVLPRLLGIIGTPTTKRQFIAITLVSLYLILNITLTIVCFNRKVARDMGQPPRNTLESWVDLHYDDRFIHNRFENLSIDSSKASC